MRTLDAGDPRRIGPYVLTGRLGVGGMGSVYLGWDRVGRPAAVKVVRTEFLADPDFRARFRREISAARRVSGPWISRVLDADPDADSPWLATEYVPGPTLDTAITGFGALPAETVAVLAQCLGQALAAVHEAGVVHRDVKPNNILLAADGPRLIDFGIARAADDAKLTATQATVLGVAGFIAPERIERQTMLPAGDIFAAGALLAFAATGRLPFGTGEPVTVAYRVVHADPDLDDVPEELRPLIARCLAKNPADRPDAATLATEAARLHNATNWPGAPTPAATGDTLELATSWLPEHLAMHTVRDYDLTTAHAAAETALLDLRQDARFGDVGGGSGGVGAAGGAGEGGSGGGGSGAGGSERADFSGAFGSGAGGSERADFSGAFGSGGAADAGAGPGVDPAGVGATGSAMPAGSNPAAGSNPSAGVVAGFGADIGPGADHARGGASGPDRDAFNAAGFGDMTGRGASGGPRPPRSGDTEPLPPRRKKPVALIAGAAVVAVLAVAGGVVLASGGGKSSPSAQQSVPSANQAATQSQSPSAKNGGDLPVGAVSKPGDALPTGGAPSTSGSTPSPTGSTASSSTSSAGQPPSTSAAHSASVPPPSTSAAPSTSQPPPPVHSTTVAPPPTTSNAPAPAQVPCGGTVSTSRGTGINCTFDTGGSGSPVRDSSGNIIGYLHAGTNWVICQAQGKTMTQGPYYNNWWAYTEADNDAWGWVNAVDAHGGDNDGGFGGVPMCNGSHGSPPQ